MGKKTSLTLTFGGSTLASPSPGSSPSNSHSPSRFSSLMTSLGSRTASIASTKDSYDDTQSSISRYVLDDDTSNAQQRQQQQEDADEDGPPPPPPKDRFYLAPDFGSGSTQSLIPVTPTGAPVTMLQKSSSLSGGSSTASPNEQSGSGNAWRRWMSSSSSLHSGEAYSDPQELQAQQQQHAAHLNQQQQSPASTSQLSPPQQPLLSSTTKKKSRFLNLGKVKVKISPGIPSTSKKERNSAGSPGDASDDVRAANGDSIWELEGVDENAAAAPPPDRPDEGISLPWGFSHNVHVDETFIGMPPSWSQSLQHAGFDAEEIQALQARRSPPAQLAYDQLLQSAASNPNGLLRTPNARSTSLPFASVAQDIGLSAPPKNPQPTPAPTPASAVPFMSSPSPTSPPSETPPFLPQALKTGPKRPPPILQPAPNPALAAISIASPSPSTSVDDSQLIFGIQTQHIRPASGVIVMGEKTPTAQEAEVVLETSVLTTLTEESDESSDNDSPLVKPLELPPIVAETTESESESLETDVVPPMQKARLPRIVTQAPPRLSLNASGLDLDFSSSWSDDLLSALPSASDDGSSHSSSTIDLARRTSLKRVTSQNRRSFLASKLGPRPMTPEKSPLPPASATSEPTLSGRSSPLLGVGSNSGDGIRRNSRALPPQKPPPTRPISELKPPALNLEPETDLESSDEGEIDHEEAKVEVLQSPPMTTPLWREVVRMVKPQSDLVATATGMAIPKAKPPPLALSDESPPRSPSLHTNKSPSSASYHNVLDWDEYYENDSESRPSADILESLPSARESQSSSGSTSSSNDEPLSISTNPTASSPSPKITDAKLPLHPVVPSPPIVVVSQAHEKTPTPPPIATHDLAPVQVPDVPPTTSTDVTSPADLISPLAAMPSAGLMTPATPAVRRYHGWVANVLTNLEPFIDGQKDPRALFDDLIEIAEGDSGSVYAARIIPTASDKSAVRVAIKNVSILPNGSQKLKDLHHELEVLKNVSHVHVLALEALYVDVVEQSLWLRMELMERSLADVVTLIQDGLMVQERMVARFASDVLSALEYLQGKFIAHRDLRSDNLLFNSEGFLKIADFSNAVQVSRQDTNCTGVAGVIYWQAPEVRKSPSYDAMKVDVWSLGATLWETAESEPPFADVQDQREIGGQWPALTRHANYTKSFHEFLKFCSQPAASRPSPTELLQTSFIRNACGRAVNVHLLAQCAAKEEALLNQDSETAE